MPFTPFRTSPKPSGLLCCLLVAVASPAAADDTAYCKQVRARARGEASLLIAPRVSVQGIRFPQEGTVDVGQTAGNGYQIRAALAASPLDVYRGVRTLRVADAACAEHDAGAEVQDLIEHGEDLARSAALNAQVQYLEAHQADWQSIADTAEKRFASRLVTLMDLLDTRRRTSELDRKIGQLTGELRQLEAGNHGIPLDSLPSGAQEYSRRAVRLAEEVAALRDLDSWQFRVTGGVVPSASVDWYAMAELSISLGAVEHHRQGKHEVRARAEELSSARYEISAKLAEYQARVDAAFEQAKRELAIVTRDLAELTSTLGALPTTEGHDDPTVKDALRLHHLTLESERVYFEVLTTTLTRLRRQHHGD